MPLSFVLHGTSEPIQANNPVLSALAAVVTRRWSSARGSDLDDDEIVLAQAAAAATEFFWAGTINQRPIETAILEILKDFRLRELNADDSGVRVTVNGLESELIVSVLLDQEEPPTVWDAATHLRKLAPWAILPTIPIAPSRTRVHAVITTGRAGPTAVGTEGLALCASAIALDRPETHVQFAGHRFIHLFGEARGDPPEGRAGPRLQEEDNCPPRDIYEFSDNRVTRRPAGPSIKGLVNMEDFFQVPETDTRDRKGKIKSAIGKWLCEGELSLCVNLPPNAAIIREILEYLCQNSKIGRERRVAIALPPGWQTGPNLRGRWVGPPRETALSEKADFPDRFVSMWSIGDAVTTTYSVVGGEIRHTAPQIIFIAEMRREGKSGTDGEHAA